MANNSKGNEEEPSTAPDPNRWYNIKLGHSFKDRHPSSKFCSLRYEFKPASIDKSQPGSLHKRKDNRITVEFHNNQAGKPKVTFEGSSEDYKENDAVLFFDGETFRLERLHRAVKRLRHVRLPGESAAPAATTSATLVGPPVPESYSPPVGKGAKPQSLTKGAIHSMPFGVERIDTGDSEAIVPKPKGEKVVEYPSTHPNPSAAFFDPKDDELDEHVDILNDDDDNDDGGGGGIDINLPHQNDAEEEFHTGIDINLPHPNDPDDEIAVDVSDDEADKGPNAAEALRALVNAEGRVEQTSSSSGSSGTETSGSGSGSASRSGSGSGSSSSDSESSEDVSVNSI